MYGLSQNYQVWISFLTNLLLILYKYEDTPFLLLDKISIQGCDLVFEL